MQNMRGLKIFFVSIGIILILLLSMYVFRYSLLRSMGNFLMRDEAPVYMEYACVLSGGAYDRGLYGANLYKQHDIKHFICTGGNIAPDLAAWGMPLLESDVTRHRLISMGVDSAAISMIHAGTSTREEADTLVHYCKNRNIKEIAIISSRFHTRRVRNVFERKFATQGIKVHIWGAPGTSYHENTWWENEDGLLFVNNEYVKLLYYMLKK